MDNDKAFEYIYNELKSIRYLMHNFLLLNYDVRGKLEELAPSKREYKIKEYNENGEDIKFDMFVIPKDKYNNLVKKYGMDTITKACVKLEEFIRKNDYIPYRTPTSSLQHRFIKEVLFEKTKEVVDSEGVEIKFEDVDTKEKATQFLLSKPRHLWSIDEECIKIKKEFDL